MLHERLNHYLLQALDQAGLATMNFRERLDLSDTNREVTATAVLPGREWPARTYAEFSYHWTAVDTARSLGDVDPDPFGELIDLTCILHYSPFPEEYTLQVSSFEELDGFMRTLVESLPPALKDEMGGNTAEVHLLIGESEGLLMYGPLTYQLSQIVDLSEDEEEGEEGNVPEMNQPELQATLRDLAADALRGLMALDAIEPPHDLFTPVPEAEEEFEDEYPDDEDDDEEEES